jgi:dTDP-4-dehydrorhamnose reductase
MTPPRILVTGLGGLLAPYLIEAASSKGFVITSGRRAGDIPCELTNRAQVAELVRTARPDWILHSAAMTHIESCQANSEKAKAANISAVENLVANLGNEMRVVLFSTDQVYRDVRGPHSESSEGPVNVYGQTKLVGERSMLKHPGALVLRVNFFGPSRSPGRESIYEFIIDSLLRRNETTLFEDVFFSPLHMCTLSSLTIEAVSRGMSGIYNLGSRNGMSKAHFGFAVAKHLRLDSSCLIRGQSDSDPLRTPRPHDLRMDVTKIEKELGVRMPTLRQEIKLL